MTHDEDLQLYLRAEPSDGGRALLVSHQRALAHALAALHITPRLVARGAFHRTELFLGSARAWTRALRRVGHVRPLLPADLLALVDLPRAQRRLFPAVPERYEPFFPNPTTAAFVLRCRSTPRSLERILLHRVHSTLRAWERDGTLPPGAAKRLSSHHAYPLRRAARTPAPHITLARGHVHPARRRDLARSLRATRLASTEPIEIVRIDARAVRIPTVIASFAP